MLAALTALTTPHLLAIAELERRTVAVDGGRLKLEPDALAREHGWHRALWWDDGRLVGFAGVYTFGGEPELAGMVDPAVRRRGVGSALLGRLCAELATRGTASALLVAPRSTGSGRDFARAHGGTLSHSEHALLLSGAPARHSADADTTVRVARPGDTGSVLRLLDEAFGQTDADVLARGGAEHLVVERGGAVIGYLRASLTGDEGGVHGFVIDASLRGQGIGRDVLARACARLRAEGAERVGLEVAVDNERALGLYTSLGFEPVTTEDYFRIDPAAVASRSGG